MNYYLFHPVFSATQCDSTEWLSHFMCIGQSRIDALEGGYHKTKSLADASLIDMVKSFKITEIDVKHALIVDKIIERFGHGLTPKDSTDKNVLSMVALLLKMGNFEAIDQVVDRKPVMVHEF